MTDGNLSPTAVEMRGITMMFGSFKANDDVNFTLNRQEIHAILGENGAGKSTLMNVLYGLLQPTAGEIFIDGKQVTLDGPAAAIELGIGMVHQHFMLIPPFTVTENIILGQEPLGPARTVNIKKAREIVRELSDKYGLGVDPDAKIEDISVGMQQRCEILKVLYRGARVLILDEPTSSLTPQEIDELGQILQTLVEQGKSIVIITHKLAEIKAMADRCTIIRQGRHIDTVAVADVTERDLAAKMVGRDVDFTVEKTEKEPGEALLEVSGLTVLDYRGLPAVDGLSVSVRAGELVGIAGVDGNGQSEFISALTGLKKAESGKISVCGQDAFNKTPRQLFDMGISSIPEDRQKHGLVLDFSVSENLILQNYGQPPFSKKGMLRRKAIQAHADELIEKFDIRPAGCSERRAGALSGGNQQKAIIAREVTNDRPVLICVNPTRGLDVGAIEYVHKYILEQRDEGKAVLLVSFELEEIMNLSDRIDVMYRGKIVGSVPGAGADQNELGLMMAGGGRHEE